MKRKSLKDPARNLAKVNDAAIRLGHQPPFTDREVICLLKSLHEEKVGQTTADNYRLAISWWHQISGHPDPCGKQTARLCDAIHRDLPNTGNPARRPFTSEEAEAILRLCRSKSMVPGDVWDRNGTIFALDLSTALRIEDLLGLRHEHLRWQEYPTRLSVYITDGKTDKFSVGKWTTDFMQSPHNINDGLRRLKMFVASSRNTTGFIFRSQGEEHDPNSHVSYDTMRRTLLNLAGKIGIVDLSVIGWHSCRKTKACLTFQETGKEEAVREVLGHAKKSANYKKYLNRPVGAK